MEKFTGKVWVLGDDIDTDIIIPTEYLALPTVDENIWESGVSLPNPLPEFSSVTPLTMVYC